MNAKNLLDSFSLNPTTYSKERTWVECSPFTDQLPGVDCLVKPVRTLAQEHYVEMWVESVLQFYGPNSLNGSTWVVGGDLRHFFRELFDRVISVLASYQIKNIYVPRFGLATSAAMSLLVRKYSAIGGIYITAAFKDAGPNGFSGFKLLASDGGIADMEFMRNVFFNSKELKGYHRVPEMGFPLKDLLSYGFKVDGHYFYATVCDAVKIYADYMEDIFDFAKINDLLTGKGDTPREVKILVDCVQGAGGPYAAEIFEHRLGCPPNTVLNPEPAQEYTYKLMAPEHRRLLRAKLRSERYDAGFALCIVAETVLVMGTKGCTITPGDSAAILAAHLHCIPYFQTHGILGFARTIPLARGIDMVAERNGYRLIETPVGREQLFNLIKQGKVSLACDEAYGVASSHLLEKDGIWGVLAWLSVLCHMKLPIYKIIHRHWMEYGRIFTARIDCQLAREMLCLGILARVERLVTDPELFGSAFGEEERKYVLLNAENVIYFSPDGKEEVRNCGLVLKFECASRIICRQSTAHPSALRIYLEHYAADPREFLNKRIEVLRPLFTIIQELTEVERFGNDHLSYETF